MKGRIFIYLSHRSGVVDDCAAELTAAARKIAPSAAPVAILTGSGPDVDAACKSAPSYFSEIWKVANDALAHPNSELVRQALVSIVPAGSIVLLAHDHFGMDLGPGLAVKFGAAYLPDVLSIVAVEPASLIAVRQEFGGQINAHVRCDTSSGGVLTVRPGAFKPETGATEIPAVVDKSSEIGQLTARRRYLQTVVAEAGDVDITKEQVLVSVGRGIQEKENIAIAEELAEALGGAVSCSRPVVDAKWLPKSRQVGTSGQTVKPKIYLACGISGSFQHLAGIKGSPLIIAINKNPKAPIFQAAQVGIVADLLEFLPELTGKINEARTVKA